MSELLEQHEHYAGKQTSASDIIINSVLLLRLIVLHTGIIRNNMHTLSTHNY